MKPCEIRNIQEADLSQIMEIERACFPSPWSLQSFLAEFEKDYSMMVCAVEAGQIAGYLIAWLLLDEIHIANLAVHPKERRRGIGESLVQYLINRSEGFRWIALEVRESNRGARKLYEKLGFHRKGIRRNYYTNEIEDAVIMQKDLIANN